MTLLERTMAAVLKSPLRIRRRRKRRRKESLFSWEAKARWRCESTDLLSTAFAAAKALESKTSLALLLASSAQSPQISRLWFTFQVFSTHMAAYDNKGPLKKTPT